MPVDDLKGRRQLPTVIDTPILSRLTTDYTDITDEESECGCFCIQIRAIREIRGQRDVGLAQFLMNSVSFHDFLSRQRGHIGCEVGYVVFLRDVDSVCFLNHLFRLSGWI
ncbi:MAG: hypothetical protein JWM11_1234 [Planctomycetaceae bacterium]|nr:hypothetical protein [Planctomycetaceae bacterium]